MLQTIETLDGSIQNTLKVSLGAALSDNFLFMDAMFLHGMNVFGSRSLS